MNAPVIYAYELHCDCSRERWSALLAQLGFEHVNDHLLSSQPAVSPSPSVGLSVRLSLSVALVVILNLTLNLRAFKLTLALALASRFHIQPQPSVSSHHRCRDSGR